MLYRFETGPQVCFVALGQRKRHVPRFAWRGKSPARRPDKGCSSEAGPDIRRQKPVRGLKLRSNTPNDEELTACQPRQAIGCSLDIVYEHTWRADLLGDFGFVNGPGNVC